ncbi:MAG: hypothetical protein CSA42_08470, partial [Gammaproteobacteria bacterium]
MIKRFVIILTLLVLCTKQSMANDGAFYLSGNHLIPISESDIKVSKEVLNIVREGEFIFVTVDYTFFNPADEKTVLVGFEADSPTGDVQTYPKNGTHPYIEHFSVIMNEEIVPYKVAIVDKKEYFIQDKIEAKTVKEVTTSQKYIECPECANFFYVYYFHATFKSGKNKLIHTYRFRASESVITFYDIAYVLTAATRWANRQIDDFTLNVNMGDYEVFRIDKTFFSDKGEWEIDNGISRDDVNNDDNSRHDLKFMTYSGGISFKAKNFNPQGEFLLYSLRSDKYGVFDYRKDNLPSQIYTGKPLKEDDPFMIYPPVVSQDRESFKILRNLPFALRGYVFKTPLIQTYYEKQRWYKPNPDYKKTVLEELSEHERQW